MVFVSTKATGYSSPLIAPSENWWLCLTKNRGRSSCTMFSRRLTYLRRAGARRAKGCTRTRLIGKYRLTSSRWFACGPIRTVAVDRESSTFIHFHLTIVGLWELPYWNVHKL